MLNVFEILPAYFCIMDPTVRYTLHIPCHLLLPWMRRYNAACSQCFKFRLHDLWYCKPTNIVPFVPTLKLQYYDFNNCWMLWTFTCIFSYSKSDHEIIVYLLSFIASLKLCQRFKLCLHGRWNCEPKNTVLVMVACWCFSHSYEC